MSTVLRPWGLSWPGVLACLRIRAVTWATERSGVHSRSPRFRLSPALDRMAVSKNGDIDIPAITAEGLWLAVLRSFAYPAGRTQMNERCQAMNDKPIKTMESCPQINCQGDKRRSGDRGLGRQLEDGRGEGFGAVDRKHCSCRPESRG